MSVEVQTFTAERINPRRIRSAPVEGPSTMIRFDLNPAVQVSPTLFISSVFTEDVGGAITWRGSWQPMALSDLSYALEATGLARCRIEGDHVAGLRLIITPEPGREMVPIAPMKVPPKAPASGSFAEVTVHFKPALRADDRTLDCLFIPEGGARSFMFKPKPESHTRAVAFAARINAESGGRLKAHFNPLNRMVTVSAPEAEPATSSEIVLDEPLLGWDEAEDDDEDILGVRALWSALRNNGRRGAVVLNSSTIESAKVLIDWGLAVDLGQNRLGRSELAQELFTLEVNGDC